MDAPWEVSFGKERSESVLPHTKQFCRNKLPFLLHLLPYVSILVLPYMASLVAKKKGNQLYYYVVESARVDGQPRIVHQAYLGTAEKVAALVKDGCATSKWGIRCLRFFDDLIRA